MSDEVNHAGPLPMGSVFPRPRALARTPVRAWGLSFRVMLLTALTVYGAAFSARAYLRDYKAFLPDYLRWTLLGTSPLFPSRPTHVFVLFTDHFEPDQDVEVVQRWATQYATLAA